MKREVLKRYFEKESSASENTMVEEWLLDAQNQTSFERFLESYWDEHVKELPQLEKEVVAPEERKHGLLRRYMPRVAVAAAVLTAVLFSVHLFTTSNVEGKAEQRIAAVTTEPVHRPVSSHSDTVIAPPKSVVVRKTKTKQYGRKNLPEIAVAPAPVPIQDTATKSIAPPKALRMTAFTKVMFNDSAFSKLSKADQLIVINQMALKIDFNNASFRDLAVNFRERYGIVLELCAGTTPDKLLKNYTASFAKITLPDLISDMSNQMMFSYTVSDNIVKICFN